MAALLLQLLICLFCATALQAEPEREGEREGGGGLLGEEMADVSLSPQPDSWPCGHVLVPSGWSWSLHYVGSLELQDRAGEDKVRVSLRGTDLYCTCDGTSSLQEAIQLSLHVSNRSSVFMMSVNTTVTCGENVLALCLHDQAQPLLVPSDTSVRLLLQDGVSIVDDVFKLGEGERREAVREMREGVRGEREEEGEGGVKVWWLPGGGAAVTNTDKDCQEVVGLELSRKMVSVNPSPPSVTITSFMPFDACSCVNAIESRHIPVLMTRLRSSESSIPDKHPEARHDLNTIHARGDNDIHAPREGRLQLTSSAVQRQRVLRQANQPPYFSAEEFQVGVVENSPANTIVTTVLAFDEGGGSEGLSYSMSSTSPISSQLFQIRSDTGVIRTTSSGEEGGRGEGRGRGGVREGRGEGGRGE